MIKFDGRIVQFGFGAVGKSFYEKVSKEIKFNENKYFVLSKYAYEFDAFINLGGMVENFITQEVTADNFGSIFGNYLKEGDLLLDFADTVGTKDICDWCATHNIMYLNTGDATWAEGWPNIFEQNQMIHALKEKHSNHPLTNQYPILLQHGNNPGLVSHFVKAGIAYIAKTQHKKNKELKALIKLNQYNKAAQLLGIKMIHVNDIDLQRARQPYDDKTLVNTWCVDSFLFEAISEATMNLGTHEEIDFQEEFKFLDIKQGFLELQTLATEQKCRTYYPNGIFEGFLIPHEETVSIAKSLEVWDGETLIYRPSVMFLYEPFHLAQTYLENAKVNGYPNPDLSKPADGVSETGQTIIRGYCYPEHSKIVYQENIESGTEYVGVLLIGDNFKPVWVGNRVELSFLYQNKKESHWQTPTITPVAMSALAGVCWMLKHKNQGGIYVPEDITDYKFILKQVEKYISKTIYETFETEVVEEALQIDSSSLQAKDFFVC